MNIDWSKAPEGATHYCSARNAWFKNDEHDMWLVWQAYGRMHEKPLIGWCFCHAPDSEFLSTKEWSGEGLPPVGIEFEYTTNSGYNWHRGSMLFSDSQAVLLNGYHLFKIGDPDIAFRPLHTPEQITADERESASVELAGILSGHDQHIAVRDIEMAKYLYDAGYRKQVTP